MGIRTAQIFHPLLAVIRSCQNRRKALKLLDLLRNQNHPKLSSFIRCYYRVAVTAKVYNSSGRLVESKTSYSGEVYY